MVKARIDMIVFTFHDVEAREGGKWQTLVEIQNSPITSCSFLVAIAQRMERTEGLDVEQLEKQMAEQQPDRHREDFQRLDKLTEARVIGDVLEPFAPCMEMAVYYGLRQVTNGSDLTPFEASSAPNVQIAGNFDDGSQFTLVMLDPDVEDPTKREYVHWLVTDIPGGTDPIQGKDVLPYERPKPAAGTHRYIFALFKQSRPMMALPPLIRANFSTRCFAQEHGLGLPVAAVYFKAQGMEA